MDIFVNRAAPAKDAQPAKQDDVKHVARIAFGVLLYESVSASHSESASCGALPNAIVALLDRLLLALMVVELLYTVQISFREHALVPEPFLLVGLVAATRRILVVTAEMTGVRNPSESAFRVSMIELSVLTIMILVFVISLILLRGRRPGVTATRA